MKFEKLIEFSSWDFIFSMITFLVLFLILKHFFFEKVHNFMENRRKEVEDALDNAAEASRLADEKLADYEKKITDVSTESRRIIKTARDEAKLEADSIISEANEEAHKMFKHSQQEIEREKFNAEKELREEVGTLAVMAARRILKKEIKPEDHKGIVDDVIKEVEAKRWN